MNQLSAIQNNSTLPNVNRLEAFFTGVAYAPHRHDTYTIGITMQGVQSFEYRGATRHSLPGNMVVLHPDEMHDGRAGTEEGFRYRTIYIEPSLIQSVLQGKPLPFVKDGITSDPRLYNVLLPLLENTDQPFEMLEYQDAVYDLAMALEEICGHAQSAFRFDYILAERARQHIHEQMDDGVTMESLARVTNCDKWELSRHFRAMFGTSPYRYLTMRRLDKARRMMVQGNSIADTAIACSFSDQSHFTRQFKKTFGLSPKAWLKTLQ